MSREVAVSVDIGTLLIGLSIMLFVLMGAVLIGTGLRNNVMDTLFATEARVSLGQLNSLREDEFMMPMSAAYAIVRSNANILTAVYYKEAPVSVELALANDALGARLASQLRGRVSLQILEPTSGVYQVYVHKESCTWLANNIDTELKLSTHTCP